MAAHRRSNRHRDDLCVVALTLTPRDRKNRNNRNKRPLPERRTHSTLSATTLQSMQSVVRVTSVTFVTSGQLLSAKGHLSKLSNRLPTPTLTYVFTVIFYGLKIFYCKVTQLCVTQRECRMAETPSVRNGAQAGENARKNSFVDYESPALTAELQALSQRT